MAQCVPLPVLSTERKVVEIWNINVTMANHSDPKNI